MQNRIFDILTFDPLKLKVMSLYKQYRGRPTGVVVPFDQALHCCQMLVLVSPKLIKNCPKWWTSHYKKFSRVKAEIMIIKRV